MSGSCVLPTRMVHLSNVAGIVWFMLTFGVDVNM